VRPYQSHDYIFVLLVMLMKKKILSVEDIEGMFDFELYKYNGMHIREAIYKVVKDLEDEV
jgi:hypothetical protein